MKEGLQPKENKEEGLPTNPKEDLYFNNENSSDASIKMSRYLQVPLSEEELKMTANEIATRYNMSINGGYKLKNRGYRLIYNPNYTSNYKEFVKEKEEIKKFIDEVTPVNINSVETIFTNKEEQKIVKEIVEKYESLAYRINIDRDSKKYKLTNGKELTIGDFVILDKLINFKVFRGEDGQLMMYKEGEDKASTFARAMFFNKGRGENVFVFKDNFKNINKDKSRINQLKSLESFSPEVFKMGIFKEEDFSRNSSKNKSYEIIGPHERSISKNKSQVFLSNSAGGCKYYIGKDSYNGTNKKINHKTVRVSLLDNETGVVTDIINGRKMILYTFPLLNKEERGKKEKELFERRTLNNKSTDINPNDLITTKAELKEYLITDYVSKDLNESDVGYANRISKLSDTSYVLGNFRSFMSETGLAANNYTWREQLVLADALTSIEEKNKIINFSKNFGKNGIRTFLSVEQGGKEMGNKIIELTNILPKEILKDIFEGYTSLLDEAGLLKEKMSSVKEIQGVTPELVEKIPSQIYNALLLRTKDILLGAHVLSEKKELNGLNVLNVREATDGVSLMLKILNDMKIEDNFSFKELNRTEQNFKYEIIDKKTKYKYGLKIFLRPKAEKNAQARVNMELSFDTDNPNARLQKAFLNKIESHTQNKIMNGSVLRVGIDREERDGGQISLDIGRSEHNDKELTRTGDVLGNLLAVASEHGHHTTESFDPRFAEEENFAQIVKLFENYLGGQKN